MMFGLAPLYSFTGLYILVIIFLSLIFVVKLKYLEVGKVKDKKKNNRKNKLFNSINTTVIVVGIIMQHTVSLHV